MTILTNIFVGLIGFYLIGFIVCAFVFRRWDKISHPDAIKAGALLWIVILPMWLRENRAKTPHRSRQREN